VAVLLTPIQIKEKLPSAIGWEPIEGREIRKKFAFKDFSEALRFVNRVGELAEGMDHHPDILLHGYKFVTLTLTTHQAMTTDGQKASGLTRMDFDLAARIDKAFLDEVRTVS
jgi:4a-hydroxytetrahydrobiopterin dehydratase